MRKEKIYTITDEGRDQGKSFFIREMSAERAEKWALRALSAAARSGVDIGQLPSGGMAAVAVLGIEALFKVSFAEAEPLLDELFGCVKIIRDPRNPAMTFDLIEDDIEEVATRFKLRMEVLGLHLDFFPVAAPSNSTSETMTAPHSSNTSTSHHSSGQPSRLKRPR